MVKNIGHGVKRTLAILLSLTIIFSLLPSTALAGDYQEHWARESVERAVEMGWFLKTEDDNYRPNASITRAEFVTMVNRMKGYTGSADLSAFFDVSIGDWYYGAFSAAVAAGYIKGSDGLLMPNAPITRNEAVTIFTRLAGLDDKADYSNILANVRDALEIPDWAKGFVGASVKNGLIAGSDERFNGALNITRGETAVLLERLFDDVRVFAFPGTFDLDQCDVTDVIVLNRNVILKDFNITNNLVISDSVGDGTVTLESVDVANTLDIRGGGKNSVYINGGTISEISINKDDVHVVVAAATITDVKVYSLSSSIAFDDGSKAKTVTINTEAQGTEFIIGASSIIETFSVNAPQTVTGIASGAQVSTFNLAQSATESKIDTESGGKIVVLNINAVGAAVSGKGTITTANIKASGAVIEYKPVKTNLDSGLKATIGGSVVTGGSGGGSGGGIYVPEVSASAEVINASTITVFTQQVLNIGFAVSGNGYNGDVSIVDYGITTPDAYTISLNPSLLEELVYTLTVSRPSYTSKNISIKWVPEVPVDPGSATIGDVTISGYTLQELQEQDVIITLEGNELSVEIEAETDLSAWFTTLPDGMTAKAKETLEVGENIITIALAGTPAEASSEQIAISIPDSVLINKSEGTLDVTANPDAKFAIVTPVPIDDLSVSGTPETSSVVLTWTKTTDASKVEIYTKAVSDDETLYADANELIAAGYSKATYSGTLSDNTGNVTVTGLNPNTTYTFRLVVTNGANAGLSNSVEAKTAEELLNVATPEFVTSGTENAFVITLQNGSFKETLGFNDFSFSGTAIETLQEVDCYVTRVSDTEVRIALKSGNLIAGTDNIVSVMATAFQTASSLTTAESAAGNLYAISGNILPGIGENASLISVAGQWVDLYSADDSELTTRLGTAQTDTNGGFTISGLHTGGADYMLVMRSLPSVRLASPITLNSHVSNANITIALPELDASEANVQFSDTGIVTWQPVENAESYDVILFKDGSLANTIIGATSGVSVLAEMHGDEGEYSVNLTAKANGYESDTADCAQTRTIAPASVTDCEYDHSTTTVSWTGTGASNYTVRIYQTSGGGNPTVFATYNVPHTDGSEELDVSDKINETTPAGTYTFTIEPIAAHNEQSIYTSLYFNGLETTVVSSDMPEITGTVEVTVTKSGDQGTTTPAVLNVGSTFTKNAGDTQEIISTSGLTITGSSDDAFLNSYAGFMLKEWSITGPGELSTTAGLGTVLTIGNEARSNNPIQVGAEFDGTGVYVAPFYLKSNSGYKIGDIVFTSESIGKVDVVKDSSFATTGLVYFITKEQSFSFHDNSRGGQSEGGIDLYTYTRKATSGSASNMWEVSATVSTYSGFTVAINGAYPGDVMTNAAKTIRLGDDISGSAAFYFGAANTDAKLLTIDGSKPDGGVYEINFGFMFGENAQNVTVKNLAFNLIGKTSAATAPDNTTAAIFLSGGENITLDSLSVSTHGTSQGALDGAGQPVYIGKDIVDAITIRDCVITAEDGQGYQAAIYISNNAFDKISITGSTLTSKTPIALNLAGVTLSADNLENISGNTMTSNRIPVRTIRLDNLSTDFINPTLSGGAVSDITLSNYFDNSDLPALFDALCNDQDGFVINLATATGNSANIVRENGAWTLTAYQNTGTLTNTTGIASGEYNKTTGILTVTTTGTVPTDVTIDLRLFVILGGVRLDTAGSDEPQYDYDSEMADSVDALSDGDWFWSGNTLTIKLSANDKARIDGIIASVPTTSSMLVWENWNSAPGYNNASASGNVVCSVTQ